MTKEEMIALIEPFLAEHPQYRPLVIPGQAPNNVLMGTDALVDFLHWNVAKGNVQGAAVETVIAQMNHILAVKKAQKERGNP